MTRTAIVCIMIYISSLILGGCSRQSVTDFTPYPSQQIAVSLGLHAIPAGFSGPDGVIVSFDRLVFGVAAAGVSDPAATGRAALQGHSHETDGREQSEPAGVSDDPNVAVADDRPLTETTFPVGRSVDLLQDQTLGVLSIRSGAETGWDVFLAPVSSDAEASSVFLTGTARHGNASSSLRVRITDPFRLSFPLRGSASEIELQLAPETWFDGIPLAQLAGSGPIEIGEDTPEWHERFIQNVVESASARDTEN